jgi:FAD synthase
MESMHCVSLLMVQTTSESGPREAISLFEAHLFDFSGDLYDQTLTIEILGTIRDNQRFGSLDELKIQIQKDATMAKTFAF